MIDNDLAKSISSIARDIGMSEFLMRQVVHEDIQYFWYKKRKSQFLLQAIMNKAFKQTQASLSNKHALVFLRWKKFQLGSDGKHRATVGFLCLHKIYG